MMNILMKRALLCLVVLAGCAHPQGPTLATKTAKLSGTAWTMHTIVPIGGTGTTTMGADGVHIATVNGKLSVCTPWEQGGAVTVAPLDGSGLDRFLFTAANATEIFTATAHGMVTGDGPIQVHSSGTLPSGLAAATNYWIIKINANSFYLAVSHADAQAGTHLTIDDDGTGTHTLSNPVVGTNVGIEDAKCLDVDGDGYVDAVSAGEGGKKIKIQWGPTWSTSTVIGAATNVEKWNQLSWGDLDGDGHPDLVAGGKNGATPYTATWGFFTTTNPRSATAWTYHSIAYVGWTMSLVALDMDGDSDLDVFLTDRTGGQELGVNKGAWWYEQVASGQFTGHQIAHIDGDPSFGDVADLDGDGDLDVVAGNKTTLTIYAQVQTGVWSAGSNLKPASGTGDVHGILVADVDGDGTKDIIVTYALTPIDAEWVQWVAQDGTAHTVSGTADVQRKPDQPGYADIDGDGDLDVVVSEGGDGVKTDDDGVVWFENPTTAPCSCP